MASRAVMRSKARAINDDVVAFKMDRLENSQLICGDVTIICDTVH
jgi:hypothetical protein